MPRRSCHAIRCEQVVPAADDFEVPEQLLPMEQDDFEEAEAPEHALAVSYPGRSGKRRKKLGCKRPPQKRSRFSDDSTPSAEAGRRKALSLVYESRRQQKKNCWQRASHRVLGQR